MDLCQYMTPEGIEARFAEVEDLREAGTKEADAETSERLLLAATLRELLEAYNGEVVEELLGRLDVEYLDDVTIVLEVCTQRSVEEELRTAALFREFGAA